MFQLVLRGSALIPCSWQGVLENQHIGIADTTTPGKMTKVKKIIGILLVKQVRVRSFVALTFDSQ